MNEHLPQGNNEEQDHKTSGGLFSYKPNAILACISGLSLVLAFIFNQVLDLVSEGSLIQIDGWYDYAIQIQKAIVNGGNDYAALLTYMRNYDHSFTPLFSLLSALVNITLNDMKLTMFFLNCAFSIGTIIVVKKIVEYTYHVEKSDVHSILILYMTNILVLSAFFITRITDPSMIFILTCAYLVNVKFIAEPSLINGQKSMLINTIVLFCREAIWLMVGFPLLMFVWNVVSKHGAYHRRPTKSILITLLKIMFFSIVFPGCIYLLFLVTFGLFDAIAIRILLLGHYTTGRSALYIIVWFILSFNVPFIFLILGLRKSLIKKEAQHLYLWAIFFTVQKIIAPGPFYPSYWLPLTFSVIIISWFSIKENRTKVHPSRIMIFNICFNFGFCIFISLFPEFIINLIIS
jgi:hypothetical protein